MRKFYLMCLTFLMAIAGQTNAQTSFSFSCAKDTTINSCVSNCLTLKARIPDIRSSTNEYIINPLTGPGGCYNPYVNPGVPGNPTALSVDDTYSGVITLPFLFPFYGTNFPSLVASTNGYLSFDITEAGQFSHWNQQVNGNVPDVLYDRALIMGVFHDIDPSPIIGTSPTQLIKYDTIGIAPHRKFILSFYKVPLFSTACNPLIENIHQIVLYEGIGIVEVFVTSLQQCPTWNGNRKMIGMQNFNRDKGIIPPGRGSDDPAWGTPNMNESWRFVPAEGPTLFRSVGLYNLAGTLVATGDTTSIGNQTFDVSFPNVCPVGTTTYIVRSTYENILAPGTFITGTDTVTVIAGTTLSATTAIDSAGCGTNGSVTVTVSGGTGTLQYSSDGGITWQASNIFSLPAGIDTILFQQLSDSCTGSVIVTIPVIPNSITGTFIPDSPTCSGGNDGSITVVAGGGNAPYEYSINGGPYQATGVFNNLSAAGSPYIITIKDSLDCLKDSAIVIIDPPPLSATAVTDSAGCGTNGSVTITVTGGPGPFEYSSDGGVTWQLSNVFSLPAGADTISFHVIGSNCIDTIIVVVPQVANSITATYISDNPSCNGSNDGSITVVALGGTAPYEYSINGGPYQPTGIFTNLSASGSPYIITIKDSLDCLKDTTIAIAEPPALSATAAIDSAGCGTNGLVTVTVTGSTGTLEYSSDGGVTWQLSNVFSLPVGQDTIRFRVVGTLCLDSIVVVVPQAANSITAGYLIGNILCNGNNNGSIQINASGGSGTLGYSINGGAVQPTGIFNNLSAAGSPYTIRIIDTAGCIKDTVINITEPAALIGTAVPVNASCLAAADGTITITVSGGTSGYTYSIDNGVTYQSSNVFTAGAGSYTVIIRDANQCTDTLSNIALGANPDVTVNAGDDVSIALGAQTQLNGVVTGTTSILWTSIPDNSSLSSTTVVNPIASPEVTTTYTLTANNGQACFASDEITVTVTGNCLNVRNAFTPNGDGINDFWKVYDSYECLKNVTVHVFNRYGSKVYESKDYKNTWNGRYKGKPVPDATYYAVIDFILTSGKAFTVKTDLTILR